MSCRTVTCESDEAVDDVEWRLGINFPEVDRFCVCGNEADSAGARPASEFKLSERVRLRERSVFTGESVLSAS